MFHQGLLIIVYGYDLMVNKAIQVISQFREEFTAVYITVPGCKWRLPSLVYANPWEGTMDTLDPYGWISIRYEISPRSNMIVVIACIIRETGDEGRIMAPLSECFKNKLPRR